MNAPQHAHPEDQVDQYLRLLHIMAGVAQGGNDLPPVQDGLQPLQGQALAGPLGADENGQVAEAQVDFLDLGEMVNG